jgi:predicted short-subunit dehydrogenase-like oxidoreductase (DUF2520 family)
MIPRTPSTFVIGAGPVATALAGGLRRAGVPVLGLWARRPEQARAAGAASGVAAYSSAPPDLLLEAAVVIVAVADRAIAEVARMLVGTGLVGRSHVLVHCSGAVSAGAAFAGVSDRIGGAAIMHPLRAIPDGRAAMGDLAGTVFGVEGDASGLQVVRDLVIALGGRPLELAGDKLAAYHAAAATASNYLVALVDAAAQMLECAGIEGEDAVGALLPLMRGTLENIAGVGVSSALTGPIRRGDAETVARHLDALAGAPPRVVDTYRVLGRLTVELARSRGEVAAEQLDEIEALLSDETAPAAGERRLRSS